LGKKVHILLIEDNLGDIRLIQEALKESDPVPDLDVIKDGEQALNFLYKKAGYENAETPSLIFLDLNMPKKDGREVLEQIKKDDFLKRIPVIVFSSSEAEKDIQKTYDLHGNCYIVKPFDFTQFCSVMNAIQNFWLNIVKLPDYNG
jgi:two-component system, chemotaxis family, response regulator Rcp1